MNVVVVCRIRSELVLMYKWSVTIVELYCQSATEFFMPVSI